ncbi:MAG: N-6 DNA methylase [Lachnospiraceae bacterium]|nr:N-6 DNA methylase [Lachnospiraceae bacterium]
MVYKYCENKNFKDLASGKVIVHKAGYPNFPIRLAQEIFCRCLHYLDNPNNICIYDPCCGGGYLLTILGFLNFGQIKTIIASDISDEAIQLANENLSLLNISGLEQRIQQLNHYLLLHNKNSHAEALKSATNLLSILTNSTHEIKHKVFKTNILSSNPFNNQDLKVDIIFTDVPYGNLVKWQDKTQDNINLLDQFLPIIKDKTIIAICSDKSQKFQSNHFQRIEKQMIGKRLFQIFQQSTVKIPFPLK